MKQKIILLLLLFISSFGFSQKTTVDYVKYKKYTSVEKNNIDVSDDTKTFVVFDSDLNTFQTYKNSEWVSLISKSEVNKYVDSSFVNLFKRKVEFSETNTTGTSNFQNESSSFSGWGSGIGIKNTFNVISFKVRGFNSSELPTKVNVRIKELNSGGTVLAEKTVNYSERDENNNLLIKLNKSVTSSSYLWFEFLTDGRVGWNGTSGTADPTQNEPLKYTTSKNINGVMTSTVTGSPLHSIKVDFYNSLDEYEITQAGVDYLKTELNIDDRIINLFDEITIYDGISSEITPVFSNGAVRGSPFAGWGMQMNKVGVSFNYLRLKNLRRSGSVTESQKWAFMKIFVKDSPSASDNIATSKYIKVDKESSLLDEVNFPLIDPVTGNYITLTDASFSGSTYFVGYVFYNSEKEVAYGGETQGSQSNFSGNSYYTTNINSTTWSVYTANPPVPVEHLLMVNPSTSYRLIENESLKDRITVLENETASLPPPRVILPDYFDAVVGYKHQLFFRGIIEDLDPINNYNIKVTGNVGGKQYPRYYEFTPTSAGTYTFIVTLYDKSNNLLTSATTNILVADTGVSPGSTKRILCIGDSLTAGGAWTGELQRLLAESGGTPTALNLNNIELIGTVGSSPNRYEGYGGKTWAWYITETTNADVPFTLPSHNKNSSDLVSIWQDSNSNQWTLEAITNSTTIVFSRLNHTNNPPNNGVLTHVSGANNTSNITYNSFSTGSGTVVNKFWNTTTDELDFTNYVTSNSFGSIDYVCVLLTWNGMSGDRALASDHSALITQAKTFIDKLHAQYPAAKIKLGGIQLPSVNGGLAQNYGDATSGYGNYYALARTVFGLNLAYQDLANEAAYSSFVEFVNISAQFDSLYNMPEGSRAVNSRNPAVETVGVNGVHPNNYGYLQIADAFFRSINKEF